MVGAGDILVSAGDARWPFDRAWGNETKDADDEDPRASATRRSFREVARRLQVGSSNRARFIKLGKTGVRPKTKIELNTFGSALESRQTVRNGSRSREALAMETSLDELGRTEHASGRDMPIDNLERDSSQLAEVRSALCRVHAGTVGFCVGCEEKINPKRLPQSRGLLAVSSAKGLWIARKRPGVISTHRSSRWAEQSSGFCWREPRLFAAQPLKAQIARAPRVPFMKRHSAFLSKDVKAITVAGQGGHVLDLRTNRGSSK